jgi:hypothetical protein
MKSGNLSRRSRHQLSCSRKGAKYINDPILNYNSYGVLNCGIISDLNLSSWLHLGYQARYEQLGDHTVSQVSWDGEHFAEFHRHQDDQFPMDRRIAHVFSGAQVPKGSRQAYFKAVFYAPLGSGTYNMAGIQDLLIRIHHKPLAETFKPFEIAYNWTEHRERGEVTRSHTELVTKLPYRYSLNVAGRRDPTMIWVRLNLPGSTPREKPGVTVTPTASTSALAANATK